MADRRQAGHARGKLREGERNFAVACGQAAGDWRELTAENAFHRGSELLAVLDRFEESLELIAAGIAAANRERQAFALDFFETWRGRQLWLPGTRG